MKLIQYFSVKVLTFLSCSQALIVPQACKTKQFGYKLKDPEDCHAFYVCLGNLGQFSLDCGQDYRFNETQQKCVRGKCPPCPCAVGLYDAGIQITGFIPMKLYPIFPIVENNNLNSYDLTKRNFMAQTDSKIKEESLNGKSLISRKTQLDSDVKEVLETSTLSGVSSKDLTSNADIIEVFAQPPKTSAPTEFGSTSISLTEAAIATNLSSTALPNTSDKFPMKITELPSTVVISNETIIKSSAQTETITGKINSKNSTADLRSALSTKSQNLTSDSTFKLSTKLPIDDTATQDLPTKCSSDPSPDIPIEATTSLPTTSELPTTITDLPTTFATNTNTELTTDATALPINTTDLPTTFITDPNTNVPNECTTTLHTTTFFMTDINTDSPTEPTTPLPTTTTDLPTTFTTDPNTNLANESTTALPSTTTFATDINTDSPTEPTTPLPTTTTDLPTTFTTDPNTNLPNESTTALPATTTFATDINTDSPIEPTMPLTTITSDLPSTFTTATSTELTTDTTTAMYTTTTDVPTNPTKEPSTDLPIESTTALPTSTTDLPITFSTDRNTDLPIDGTTVLPTITTDLTTNPISQQSPELTTDSTTALVTTEPSTYFLTTTLSTTTPSTDLPTTKTEPSTETTSESSTDITTTPSNTELSTQSTVTIETTTKSATITTIETITETINVASTEIYTESITQSTTKCSTQTTTKCSTKSATKSTTKCHTTTPKSSSNCQDNLTNNNENIALICANRKDGDFVKDPKACNKYYTCYQKHAYHQTCHGLLYFDDKFKMCNYPELVECNQSSKMKSSKITINEYIPQRHPHKTNHLTEAKPKKQTANNYPQPQTQIQTTKSFALNNLLEQKNHLKYDDCKTLKSGTFIRDLADCRKYCVCLNGKAIDLYCPPGQYFDIEKHVCNYKLLVKNCEIFK